MEAISPQTFCCTKVKVALKMIRPQDVSALRVSWTFQAEGHFSPPKDVLHQTFSAPIHYGTITSWPLIFLNLWVEQGRSEEMGGKVGEERRWDERIEEERGEYSRIGY